MKKIIPVLTVAATCMVFACNKTKQMEPHAAGNAQPQNTKPVYASRQIGGGPKAYLLMMCTGGSNKGWCENTAANCVTFDPDIVISVIMKASIDGAAASGDPAKVAAVFSGSDFTSLNNDYLGAANADLLKSGTYYLTKVNDDGKRASYMAGPTYPVTFENMDFAFQGLYYSK